MIISNNQSLAKFNSFGLSAIAESYFLCHEERALQNALKSMPSDFLVLGGGSNMLIINDQIPAVLHNKIMGIEIIKEADDYVLIEVGAEWHRKSLFDSRQCRRSSYSKYWSIWS